MQIALVTHSARVPDLELAAISEAVNAQIIECAETWGVTPWPVVFYSTAQGLPAESCRIMDVVDRIDIPGASGYHTSEWGVVYGRVLAADVMSTAVTISHEALEMMVDPNANQWIPMPDGFATAKEVCDAVQGDAYSIDVNVAGVGRTVMLSNYVTPAWFYPGTSTRFDRMGKLAARFEMSPGGYMICRDASGKQVNRFARFGSSIVTARAALGGKFANPDGRLAQRLAG